MLRGGAPKEPEEEPDQLVQPKNEVEEHSWLKELVSAPRSAEIFNRAFGIFMEELKEDRIPEGPAWSGFLEGIRSACEDVIDTYKHQYRRVESNADNEEKRGLFFVVCEPMQSGPRNKVTLFHTHHF